MSYFSSVAGLFGKKSGSPYADSLDPDAAAKVAAFQDSLRAPTGADPAVAEAARREREAQRRARGRASTILTGGEGDLSSPNLARRFLLGG